MFASGFSYSAVPIKISTLTYTEYQARGFDLEDDFDAGDVPVDAADGKLYGLVVYFSKIQAGVTASALLQNMIISPSMRHG